MLSTCLSTTTAKVACRQRSGNSRPPYYRPRIPVSPRRTKTPIGATTWGGEGKYALIGDPRSRRCRLPRPTTTWPQLDRIRFVLFMTSLSRSHFLEETQFGVFSLSLRCSLKCLILHRCPYKHTLKRVAQPHHAIPQIAKIDLRPGLEVASPKCLTKWRENYWCCIWFLSS